MRWWIIDVFGVVCCCSCCVGAAAPEPWHHKCQIFYLAFSLWLFIPHALLAAAVGEDTEAAVGWRRRLRIVGNQSRSWQHRQQLAHLASALYVGESLFQHYHWSASIVKNGSEILHLRVCVCRYFVCPEFVFALFIFPCSLQSDFIKYLYVEWRGGVGRRWIEGKF